MGEAKRKRAARDDAYASARLFKVPSKCPACGSPDVQRIPIATQPPPMRDAFGCDIEACRSCQAFWEAFPAEGYVEDPVGAEPCDNCAFRPGSPEQANPERWRALMDSLKVGSGDGFFGDRFYCHKGVPIDVNAGPGNFLFPQKSVTMDGVPLKNPDGSMVRTYDLTQMRTCSGFLRMFWQRSRKRGHDAEEGS